MSFSTQVEQNNAQSVDVCGAKKKSGSLTGFFFPFSSSTPLPKTLGLGTCSPPLCEFCTIEQWPGALVFDNDSYTTTSRLFFRRFQANKT
jgi:hypothetical protein